MQHWLRYVSLTDLQTTAISVSRCAKLTRDKKYYNTERCNEARAGPVIRSHGRNCAINYYRLSRTTTAVNNGACSE